MFLTIQDLKVDQTVIPSDESGILVSNINIPESEFDNLDNILERVEEFVVNDYVNVERINFQVCATYELRNTSTGDSRQWCGSFNPRGNQSNTLSQFQQFDQNFKVLVKNATTPENVTTKLHFYHVQTNWVFHKLTSIIVAVQAQVNYTHPTLLRRNLLSVVRNGHHHHRIIQSFYLP